MTATIRRPGIRATLRLSLMGSSALVGSALLAGQAQAQTIPVLDNAGGASVVFSGGSGPHDTNTTMNVDLLGASRIIDFTSYDIGSGKVANYSTSVAATNLVAVNRVTSTAGDNTSDILGTINANAGISVWLINQEGITFNGTANLSGGSLMLSTLDFTSNVNPAFRTAFAVAGAANSTAYAFSGTSQNPITIGGNLNVTGSIIAVGEQITTNSALTATNGSVVLVAATDVTFTAGLGNPLSFTIGSGTQLGGVVNVNNDLNGQSIVIAGGLRNNLTATLLNINSGADLVATAANGTVTLATTTTTFGANTVTISNGGNAEASITVGGSLAATNATGDVIVNSDFDITGTGAITARRNLTLTATRDISVSGSDFEATDGALTATSRNGTFGDLTAGTDVDVTTTGNAVFDGDVGTGDQFLVDSAVDATINGDVTAGTDVLLTIQRDVTISGDVGAGGDYSLTLARDLTQSGDVVADGTSLIDISRNSSVTGLNEATTGALTVNVGGNATLGALTAGTDIGVDAGGFATINGKSTAGDGLFVRSGNNTTINGDIETGLDADLFAPGTLTVRGNADVGRDYLLDADAITLGTSAATRTQAAGGRVIATATNGDITGVGTLTLQSDAGGTGLSDLSLDASDEVNFGINTSLVAGLAAGTPAQRSDVVVTSGPDITLGNVTANTLYTFGDTILSATGNITTGNVTVDNALTIVSTGGSISTGNVTVMDLSGDIEIRAAGATRDVTTGTLTTNRGNVFVSARRDVTVGGASTALNDSATAPVAGSVGLYAGRNLQGGTLIAGEDVAARATGTLSITSALAGDDVDVLATGNVTLNNARTLGTGTGTSSLVFGATPGLAGAVSVLGLEDLTLTGSQLRAISLAGTVSSSGTLRNSGEGDVVITGNGDVSLATVRADSTTTGVVDVTSVTGSASVSSATAREEITVDGALDALVGSGTSITSFIDITAGRDAGLNSGLAPGNITLTAGRDALSSTSLTSTGGNVFLTAVRNVTISGADADVGYIGLHAGGQATGGILDAAIDVAAQGGTGVAITSATAGDDIDLLALTGNVSLGTGLANANAGTGGTSVTFTGAAGTAGSVGFAPGEDLQLTQSTIRLAALAGNASSGTLLRTFNGDVIVNASQDVSLATVTATGPLAGGTIAVRAGRDVTQATLLTSTTEDVSIGAGRNAALGTLRAADDVDVFAVGTASWTLLDVTGGLDRARFADVITGVAGTPGGVTFLGIDDIALAGRNVVRVRAADVGSSAPLQDGLFAQNVTTAYFDASAATGDIRLGDITSSGSIFVNATAGSVTGLPTGYTPAIGNSITSSDAILINVTGNGVFGAVSTPGAVQTVTTADGLRFASINASSVNLTTVNTLDVGTVVANSVVLATTGGTAGTVSLENATLATGFNGANLTSTATDGYISVNAANGIAQLGTVSAGDTFGFGFFNQIEVNARAISVVQADALDGSLSMTASDGVLRFGSGSARQHVSLTKRDDDAIGTAADILDVGIVTAGFGADLHSETSASIGSATAQGNDFFDRNLYVSAANDIGIGSGTATTGSIGLFAGDAITGTTLDAAQDVSALAGGNISVATAFAGDDIDMVSTGGFVRLDDGTAFGTGFDFTSVAFPGSAGTPGSVSMNFFEDAQLSGSTIRLRSITDDVTSTGTLETRGPGEILVNAAGDVSLNDAFARDGSIGVLSGGGTSASLLDASRDVGVQAGNGITIATANAGDDIDMVALGGTLSLTDGTAFGAGTGGTSVTFTGAPGSAAAVGLSGSEDGQLLDSTIRLRAAAGSVVSGGTLETQGRGEILTNASLDVDLASAFARNGSIGMLAGRDASANLLDATRDISAQAGRDVGVLSATAGDDIDMIAITGDLGLSGGTSTGAGTTGSSVTFGSAGASGAVGIGAESTQLVPGATIRLRAQAGDVISSSLLASGTGEIYVNAGSNAQLGSATATSGSVGVLTGGRLDATTLTASRDVAVQSGTGMTVTDTTAGDDVDMTALTGSLIVTDVTANGVVAANGTRMTFGTAGALDAVGVAAGGEGQLADSSIRLRAAGGAVNATGTLETLGRGEVLVNAQGAATVNIANAANGSIGVLAGGSATGTTLTASRDIGMQGGTGVAVTTAIAGDDIDLVAVTGTVSLVDGTSNGTAGTGGSSVRFPGGAGALDAVGVTAGEDAELAGASIRLRAAALDVVSTGTLRTNGAGDILVNAARNASLNIANATNGSIGLLAGTDAQAASLTARFDVAASAGRDVTVTLATAGDDIDMVAGRDLALLTGSALATTGTSTTSVSFGTAGAANAVIASPGEDAQTAANSAIRLRAVTGNVAGATGPLTGTTLTTAGGDILVNAAGDVNVLNANATGTVGVLAGGAIDATALTATRDIGVRGGTAGALSPTDVTIANATAGDDIDLVALNGNVAITNATSTGAGAGGTSVTFTGTPGTALAVGTGAEDGQLTGATIRLRSQAGDVTSTGALLAQGTGEVLVNASGDASLESASAQGGSVGVLAGGQVTATTLTASRDVGVQAATGIGVGTATAGDDIDMVALGGDVSLTSGTSTGAGAGGSSVVFPGAPGAAAAVAIGTEDTQLTAATIRLRAQAGDVISTGALLAQGTGEVLVNASDGVSLESATAQGGSVGVLAGGEITATTLTASRDIGVRGGTTGAVSPTNVTITTATAGDDIDAQALNGNVRLDNGTSTGAGAGGTSVLFPAAPGSVAAVGIGAEDTALAGASIRLRSATGRVISTGTLRTQGTGDVLIDAKTKAELATVTASNGSVDLSAADVDISGSLNSTGGRLIVRNTGTTGTLVGDSDAARFSIDDADLARLVGDNIVIDSGANAMELSSMTIGANNGRVSTRFIGTGAIDITGAIDLTAAGAGHTLQIGGALGDMGQSAGNIPLATTLFAHIGNGASINAPDSHVDLRGEKVMFGTEAMIDEFKTLSNDDIARKVSDASSKLYADPTAQPIDVFLTAKRVTVGYKNFALFQNTEFGGNAGVMINSTPNGLPDQSTLALTLVSTGDAGNNSFTIFGLVNNFLGTTAAILRNDVIQIIDPNGDPNVSRVTRATSRINGCIIGAPDKGCLTTDVVQPNFELYDERKIALFGTDDGTIAVNPLIGRGNDGLIVNIADAPVDIDTIECRKDDPNCPAKEGE